jgi:hypothetical protein
MDEKAIQELGERDGLSFLDAKRKFFESKPKTGNQSYASVLCHSQEVDAKTKITVVPSQTNSSVQISSSRSAASSQTHTPT